MSPDFGYNSDRSFPLLFVVNIPKPLVFPENKRGAGRKKKRLVLLLTNHRLDIIERERKGRNKKRGGENESITFFSFFFAFCFWERRGRRRYRQKIKGGRDVRYRG